MKKLILLVVFTLPLMAQAQPSEGQDWWACQEVQAAGLAWEGGNWVATGFEVSKRFLLVADGEGLTQHSVSRAMDVNLDSVICTSDNAQGQTFCICKLTGKSLGFDRRTGMGAMGNIFGALWEPVQNDYRDSLDVAPFECVKG